MAGAHSTHSMQGVHHRLHDAASTPKQRHDDSASQGQACARCFPRARCACRLASAGDRSHRSVRGATLMAITNDRGLPPQPHHHANCIAQTAVVAAAALSRPHPTARRQPRRRAVGSWRQKGVAMAAAAAGRPRPPAAPDVAVGGWRLATVAADGHARSGGTPDGSLGGTARC
jgi:hypothetical protein